MVSIWLQKHVDKDKRIQFEYTQRTIFEIELKFHYLLRWSFITTFLCTKTNTLFTIKSITACLRRNAKKEMVSNYIFPLLNNQGNMKRGFFAFYNFPCNYSGCETSSMIFTWCFIIWVEGEFPFYLLRMMENLKTIFNLYLAVTNKLLEIAQLRW